MTPSLFTNTSGMTEYSLTKSLGKEYSREILDHHWDTWIQEDDFRKMHDWGINVVRIPIGYWAVLEKPGDPFVQGQLPYLDRALSWAHKYEIHALIDLHIPPGGIANWNDLDIPGTPWIENGTSVDEAIDVILQIAERYQGPEWGGVLGGIELLNEPVSPDYFSKLPFPQIYQISEEDYDRRLYEYYLELVTRLDDSVSPVINDFFLHPKYSWFANDSRVAIDYHYYQTEWNISSLRPISETLEKVCFDCQAYANDSRPVFIGEWSASRSQCDTLKTSPALLGFLGLERLPDYCDGADDIQKWSIERRNDTRKYIETQLDAFERVGHGWIFWSYKTENTTEWDLQRLIDNELFPQPFTDRQFPNQCQGITQERS